MPICDQQRSRVSSLYKPCVLNLLKNRRFSYVIFKIWQNRIRKRNSRIGFYRAIFLFFWVFLPVSKFSTGRLTLQSKTPSELYCSVFFFIYLLHCPDHFCDIPRGFHIFLRGKNDGKTEIVIFNDFNCWLLLRDLRFSPSKLYNNKTTDYYLFALKIGLVSLNKKIINKLYWNINVYIFCFLITSWPATNELVQ